MTLLWSCFKTSSISDPGILCVHTWISGKEPACQCRRHKRGGFAGDTREEGSTPGLGRSPGGGNGDPLQYSCLGSLMDRGAWRAAVHRVTKGWTWVKRLRMHILELTISLLFCSLSDLLHHYTTRFLSWKLELSSSLSLPLQKQLVATVCQFYCRIKGRPLSLLPIQCFSSPHVLALSPSPHVLALNLSSFLP